MASQAYAKAGAGAKDHGFGWLTFAAVSCDVLVIYALARYGGERARQYAE
jgi:hypothetical protein